MDDLKAEAKAAWDGFHATVRRLDAVCKRDNVTLKLKLPTLGVVKKKKPQSDASAEQTE